MPTFNPGDEVTYPRGTPATTYKGFVSKLGEQVLSNGVTRVDILENGGARYHIDKRNVTLVPPPPPPPPPSNIRWGVNLNGGTATGPAAGIKALNATTARCNNVSQVDAVVAAGLKPLIILDAHDPTGSAAIVKKYGPTAVPGALPFEVHNEPYYDSGWGAPVDPNAYASAYKAVVQAGRNADPQAKFLVSGAPDIQFQGAWKPWADWLVAAVPDLAQFVDGWTSHPYGRTDSTKTDVDGGWQLLNYEQAAFKRNGIDKPCWITEVGFKIGPSNSIDTGTEPEQATRAQRYVDDLKTGKFPFVAAFYWFSWGNYGASDQWGIVRDDGSQRPVAAILKTAYAS